MTVLSTDFVLDDEPCFGLYEFDMQSPGSRGFHRYQILKVVRGDKLAEHWKDLGVSKDFERNLLRIPGGVVTNGRIYIEHTVGELRDLARHERDHPTFDKYERAKVKSKKRNGHLFKIK